MTAPAIAYDLSVRNLIAGLDATNHVTHVQHRKTHVTLHHNGGWLSHDGILNVWRTRQASAHFNIDAAGTAAQFVGVNEYAWACGSTEGNQRSISIEHCNTAGAPSWIVDEITWSRGARLAGWLFARVIGTRPTKDTLVFHKYWNATECAGPWMARQYPNILAIAQQTYDRIVSGQEENDMQPTDGIKLVSPGSRDRGDVPPYSEVVPLDKAVADGYFYGSDAYHILQGRGDDGGLIRAFVQLNETVDRLKEKLDSIETGGVSEKRISEIAVAAVDEKLGPN